MAQASWPLILLAMRIVVVVGLYVFVFVTVRALRAEVRARTMPVAPAVLEVPSRTQMRDDVAAPARRTRAPRAMPELGDEPALAARPVTAEVSETTAPRVRPETREPAQQQTRRRPTPWTVLAPLYAGLAVAAIGATLFALRSAPTATPVQPASNQASLAPAAGHVTVALAATEPTSVRVTIDGTVQFDGAMQAGEKRNWDGRSAIDVWTDKGKSLGLTVDGRDLGPYSPAMGHPDWNRIDYSFWPGWSQSLPR